MPSRAPRVCGCGKVHASGEACPVAAARTKERKARADSRRPSARQRGYTKEWEEAAKVYLSAYPSCRRCGGPASLVDHVTPHKGNQQLFWDRRNWQSLCTNCHSSHKQRLERRTGVSK
jgi:5-methylcytosine-specific restriction protein A